MPARQNRWGTINVEDERHCEFVYLRDFLTRTHLQDLIETTSQIHYEGKSAPSSSLLQHQLTYTPGFRAKQLLALKESSAQMGAGGSRPISPSADRELNTRGSGVNSGNRMTMNGY